MAVFAVDGLVGRTMQKVAGSSTFAAVGPKVVPPLDRFLHKVTGGRVILSRALVPSLVLTATGRTSGLPRVTPLACMPDGANGWYVVGSNFGRPEHPVWTGNLMATPEAEVSIGGAVTRVRAELLDDAAKAAIWPRLTAVWPTYDRYVDNSGRNLRVFLLRPITT